MGVYNVIYMMEGNSGINNKRNYYKHLFNMVFNLRPYLYD